MSNITPKSTKQEIYEAYLEALKVQQGKPVQHDPKAELKAKKDNEAGEVAANTKVDSIESQILGLKKNVTSVLDNLLGNISEQSRVYHDITHAIQVQQAKLQELYDIEAQADSLTALVNAQKERSQRYEETFGGYKAEAEAELKQVRAQIAEAKAQLQREYNEEKQRIAKERQRDQEEYEYNFKRQAQQVKDNLADELSNKRKLAQAQIDAEKAEVAEELKAVEAREQAVEARESKLDQLDTHLSNVKAKIETIKEEVTEEVTAKLTKEFNREKEYLIKDAKHQEDILNSRNKMLEDALNKANMEKEYLSKKVDEAHAQMRELASKTLDSSSDKKVNVALENMIKNMHSNQSK